MDKNINYKVYKVFRVDTLDVVYIGITKRTLKKRLQSHFDRKDNNPRKVNYFLKYRNFLSIESIKENIKSLKEANELEKIYIKKYKSNGVDLLNATEGGDGTKGIKPWNKGKKCTYKNILRVNSPNKKAIFSYDMNGSFLNEYNSIKQASEKTGVPRSAIKNIADLKMRFKSYKKLVFRYYKKDNIDVGFVTEKERLKRVRKGKHESSKKISVECSETGTITIYKNIIELSKHLDIKASTVYCYVHKNKYIKKRKFKYA